MAALISCLSLVLFAPRSIEDLKYQDHDAAYWRAQTAVGNESEDRLRATRALSTLGFWATMNYDNSQPWVDREIVPAVVLLLEDPDAKIREEATRALKQCRKSKMNSLPLFLKRLDDTDAKVRDAAAAALTHWIGLSPETIRQLAEHLRTDSSKKVRDNLAQALRNNGPAGNAALVELLNDKDAQVRASVAVVFEYTFSQVKPAATLLQRFQELLEDEEPEVQLAAARALTGLERMPPELVVKLVAHQNAEVRLQTANKLFALRNTPGFSYKKELLALAASDLKVRQRNAEWLGSLGSEAVPLLLKLLDDESSIVRGAAAYGLASMGRQAEPAVPRLKQLLGDMARIDRGYQELVCHAAGRALNHILGSTEYTKGLPKMEYSGK